MNNQYLIIKDYVNAATDLADQVTKDVQAGQKITTETVLQLSRFYAAAEKFRKGLEVINAINSDQH